MSLGLESIDKEIIEYEIVYKWNKVGDKVNKIVSTKGLQEITLKLAQKNHLELVDGESWISFFNVGERINDGYAFVSWKDGVEESVIFNICGEILSVLNISLFRIYENYKMKIELSGVVYRIGYFTSKLKTLEVYVDNKHIKDNYFKTINKNRAYYRKVIKKFERWFKKKERINVKNKRRSFFDKNRYQKKVKVIGHEDIDKKASF